MQVPPVMVADLGGTSLRVGLAVGGELRHVATTSTIALDGDAAPWLTRWAQGLPIGPAAACVAVAGPVRGGQVRLTNVDVSLCASDLGLPAVLVNDLHAAAMGVDRVPADQLLHLGGPPPQSGCTLAVVGVGTGLGQAVRKSGMVIPGEGGHGAFAPRDAQQDALLSYLRARLGYVDWEHVASGQGMELLLDFARTRTEESPAVAEALAKGAPVAQVVLELADRDPACELALELMLSCLGTEAGNMALRHLATGGVWFVGGVAARLGHHLASDTLRAAFEDRGRFSSLARRMPRVLVLDQLVGLRGAAFIARRLLA